MRLAPASLQKLGGALDGAGGTGDDGLVGGVEVGGGDDGEAGVEVLASGVVGRGVRLVGDLGADLGDDGGGRVRVMAAMAPRPAGTACCM